MEQLAQSETATMTNSGVVSRPFRTKALSVCHIVSGDLWAGAEVQAAGLIHGLSRRKDMRVSTIVLNEGRLASELRSCEVEVCVIPEATNNFRQILKNAEAFVREFKPDVLHSHRYKENLLAVLLARKCRIPVKVRTQHGWPEPVAGVKALHHNSVLCVDRFCGRWMTDAVIGVSAEMMPRLQSIYGSRSVLVRNGIDTDRVTSHLSPEEAKRKLCLPVDAPLIGIVGRLEQVKRIDLFLETAKILTRRIPSATYVIVGTGTRERELKAQSRALGLESSVHFLGHRDDAYDVLRALDVLLMCSDSEGLPMVLLEALWLGVPVVGRAVGGIKEVLGNDECGLVVNSSCPEDFASAIDRLLHDGELRKCHIHAAARRVQEEFSLSSSVEGVAQEYWRLRETRLANRSQDCE